MVCWSLIWKCLWYIGQVFTPSTMRGHGGIRVLWTHFYFFLLFSSFLCVSLELVRFLYRFVVPGHRAFRLNCKGTSLPDDNPACHERTSYQRMSHGQRHLNITRNAIGIVVKQAGALHRPIVLRHLNYGKYHLDYSPIYLGFFVRHVYPKNWLNPIMQWVKCDRSVRSATYLRQWFDWSKKWTQS